MKYFRKCGIRIGSGIIFLAGMILAGNFDVFWLQAAEADDSSGFLYEEEGAIPVEEEEQTAIQIAVHPDSQVVDVGGDVVFTVEASLTGDSGAALQYEWQESADGDNYYTIANGSSCWLSNVQAERNGHFFRCLVTCSEFNLEPQVTNTAQLTVRIPNYTVTVENGQADPVSAAPGSTVWITANVPADKEEFKEWVVKEGDVTLASPLSARTFFTMPDRNVGLMAAYQSKAELPVITSEPQDVQVEAGDYASFQVSASGQDLTYQWLVDEGNGSGFQEVAGAVTELYRVMVLDGSMNGYEYKCEVTNKAGAVRTRSARLTIFYKIVGGARSSWVKSSGSGLVFQGSGAYSRFSGVSVDGNRILASEYSKGGSQTPFTEITLLRSYLETLPEGDHEMEIAWSDGSAKTSFSIVPPAADLPADITGLGASDIGAAGSSRAAGTTAAAGEVTSERSDMTGGMDTNDALDRKENGERDEMSFGQISGNALDDSVSENAVKPSSGTASDVFSSSGLPVGIPQEDRKVTLGERRTKDRSSDFEKSPVQLAKMSEAVNKYAGTVCMAVILISAAGIASGIIAYRMHDTEGQNK